MKSNKCFIISVDGTCAAGKGTIARAISEMLEFDYLDTGIMYRLVGYHALLNHIKLDDIEGLESIAKSINYTQNNIDLSSEEIGNAASTVAQIAQVRSVLNKAQKEFPIGKKGVVVDGRDIGSVIFPDADCKFYISASLEVRAKRRFEQAQKDGQNTTLNIIKDKLQKRDERDMMRAVSPLVIPEGAIVIDTSFLTVEESCTIAYNHALSIIENTRVL